MNSHILIGRTRNGETVYYTGRAGALFVSQSISEAFRYDGIEAARRRASNLNQMTDAHGIRFIVPTPDSDLGAHHATVLP